jgi:hypothetical protein
MSIVDRFSSWEVHSAMRQKVRNADELAFNERNSAVFLFARDYM